MGCVYKNYLRVCMCYKNKMKPSVKAVILTSSKKEGKIFCYFELSGQNLVGRIVDFKLN